MIRALIALVFLTGAFSQAEASGIPDLAKSSVDGILVGNLSGQDMGNAFHVFVRNLVGRPLEGITVGLFFANSTARPLSQQEAGTTVDCAQMTISRVSDATGEAVFHARIAGYDDLRHVQVRANGALLATPSVYSTDLNGDGVMDLADLNAFRQQFLAAPGPGPADFNGDGVTNLADFNLFRAEFVTHAAGALCP